MRIQSVILSLCRPTWVASSVAVASLALLASCAGSPLQQSLEADPQLQDSLVFDDADTDSDADSEAVPRDADQDSTTADSPQPGNPEFIGPVAANQADDSSPDRRRNGHALLSDVPEDLRPYVQDWMALGLAGENSNGAIAELAFQPNQPITRAEYAQWLFAANNRFYADQAAKRIRPGATGSTPAFQDVPTSHPQYRAIQGLTEAGIIPSALTGNATAVNFRPDDPLTREVLVLWKVPLDTRSPLPTATPDAVKATWGFQDAEEIEPLALRAVLADRQTGDFANILRTFGFTTLFQPQKAVTQAEAAAALWRFGSQTEGVSARDVNQRQQEQAAE